VLILIYKDICNRPFVHVSYTVTYLTLPLCQTSYRHQHRPPITARRRSGCGDKTQTVSGLQETPDESVRVGKHKGVKNAARHSDRAPLPPLAIPTLHQHPHGTAGVRL
jgi:hypothetical protein